MRPCKAQRESFYLRLETLILSESQSRREVSFVRQSLWWFEILDANVELQRPKVNSGRILYGILEVAFESRAQSRGFTPD